MERGGVGEGRDKTMWFAEACRDVKECVWETLQLCCKPQGCAEWEQRSREGLGTEWEWNGRTPQNGPFCTTLADLNQIS